MFKEKKNKKRCRRKEMNILNSHAFANPLHTLCYTTKE